MHLIGLLAWFDEPPEILARCLVGLACGGVDHVVALDGRYALFPTDRDVSSPNEYAAILLGCRELGIACTISQPSGPWMGGEVEKRTALFAAGLAVSRPGDWFWVQDADQWTTECPDDLKDRLAATDLDAAEVMMLDKVAEAAAVANWPARFSLRSLFRAQPIVVRTNHVNYMTADGRHLWGRDGEGRVCNALDLTDCVTVEHHPQARQHDRLVAKLGYYHARDTAGVERGSCELCGQPAASLEPTRWRMTGIGPVADWMECCEAHKASVAAVNDIELRKLGIDPPSVSVTSRNGRAPQPVGGRACP